jgi:hypothetical protein
LCGITRYLAPTFAWVSSLLVLSTQIEQLKFTEKFLCVSDAFGVLIQKKSNGFLFAPSLSMLSLAAALDVSQQQLARQQ